MKKAGRRTTDRMRKQVPVTREAMHLFGGTEDAVGGTQRVIEDMLALRQGETVLRENWQTGKVEKWVLLGPRGDAQTRSTDNYGDDWLRNIVRFQRWQAWEAAFVSSHR